MLRLGKRVSLAITMLTLFVTTACDKQMVTIDDPQAFATQGGGASSPAELAASVAAAATSRDVAALQALVCSQKLTDRERRTFNTLFLELVNQPIVTVEYLDDIAVLKNPVLADWAPYLFNHAKHDKIVAATRAYYEQLENTDPAERGKLKMPEIMFDEPSMTDELPPANVRATGLVRIQLKDLGKASLANELYFLVGKPTGNEAYYLGTVIFPMPNEATDENAL